MESIDRIATDPFAAKGADYLSAAQTLAPGQIAAGSEQAYNAALDAQKKYEQELLAMGNLAGANKQDQINYIRRAMVSAGFNEDEISSAISRSGFMYGGKVESGLMSLKMGGMPAEMDLRKGGFVPLGKKERADDVPARLSKNEFVFTAKAVRNAGNGDVRKGAKRMYQVMNQLEARA
jgi:alkylhydroperoxidase/carboxymuconolactone decarboxylase family protein YurZ